MEFERKYFYVIIAVNYIIVLHPDLTSNKPRKVASHQQLKQAMSNNNSTVQYIKISETEAQVTSSSDIDLCHGFSFIFY